MSNLSIYLVSGLLFSSSAFALSCADGSTGCQTLDIPKTDCEELGYSLNEPDCDHYLLCPFNTKFKICVKEKSGGNAEKICPNGEITIAECDAKNGNYITDDAKDGCVSCLELSKIDNETFCAKFCSDDNSDRYAKPDIIPCLCNQAIGNCAGYDLTRKRFPSNPCYQYEACSKGGVVKYKETYLEGVYVDPSGNVSNTFTTNYLYCPLK